MATGVWTALRPPGDDVIMTVADVMLSLVTGWMQRLVCVASLTAAPLMPPPQAEIRPFLCEKQLFYVK